jgi:hypothetical protein
VTPSTLLEIFWVRISERAPTARTKKLTFVSRKNFLSAALNAILFDSVYITIATVTNSIPIMVLGNSAVLTAVNAILPTNLIQIVEKVSTLTAYQFTGYSVLKYNH